MSSRIRRGSTELVESMAWTRVESPRAHSDSAATHAGHLSPDGGAQPDLKGGSFGHAGAGEEALSALRKQTELEVTRAREQGRAEGMAAANAAAQASIGPSVRAMQMLLTELTGEKDRTRRSAEKDVVQLALAIAKRVLHRELATDPEAILGLVKSAWEKVTARETHKLRLSVSDAALLEAHRGALGFPAGLSVIPDGSLAPGSVVFETVRGQLDGSVETQLVEIERGLTDLLHRRSK